MRGETYAQFGWIGGVAEFRLMLLADIEEVWLDCMWRTLIADAGTRDGYIGRAKGEWKDAVFEWWYVLHPVSLEFLKHDRNISEEAATDLLNSEQPLLQKYVKNLDIQLKLIGDFGFNRAAH